MPKRPISEPFSPARARGQETFSWTESTWRTQPHIPDEDAALLETATMVASYELVSRLGSGFFAEVFLARRSGTCEFRAVKRIDKSKVYANANIRKRLRSIKRINSEIEALRHVGEHANVCELFETFHSPSFVYLVMEACECDLYEAVLHHFDHLTDGCVLRISRAIAAALDHCHSVGFVHRDIKPENILVSGEIVDDGRELRVKVCDFGLCGRVSADGSWNFCDFVGSPGFFAPEILISDLYNAEKLDVWGLACIVFEMCEGPVVFEQFWLTPCYNTALLHDATKFEERLRAITPVVRARPCRCPSVAELMRRCLVVDARERLSTASLVHLLAAASAPGVPQQPPPPPPSPKSAPTHPSPQTPPRTRSWSGLVSPAKIHVASEFSYNAAAILAGPRAVPRLLAPPPPSLFRRVLFKTAPSVLCRNKATAASSTIGIPPSSLFKPALLPIITSPTLHDSVESDKSPDSVLSQLTSA